jgi:hypothetical protein
VIERYTLTRNIDALEQLYTDLTRAPVVALAGPQPSSRSL